MTALYHVWGERVRLCTFYPHPLGGEEKNQRETIADEARSTRGIMTRRKGLPPVFNRKQALAGFDGTHRFTPGINSEI